jgi:hypothetical protein
MRIEPRLNISLGETWEPVTEFECINLNIKKTDNIFKKENNWCFKFKTKTSFVHIFFEDFYDYEIDSLIKTFGYKQLFEKISKHPRTINTLHDIENFYCKCEVTRSDFAHN